MDSRPDIRGWRNQAFKLYADKQYTESYRAFDKIVNAVDKLSNADKAKFHTEIKDALFHTSEILCAIVGVHPNRKKWTDLEMQYLGKSINNLEKLLNLEPFHKGAMDLHKHILLVMSFLEPDMDNGLALLKRILSVDPHDFIVQYNLGFAYHRKNELDSAMRHYKLCHGIIEAKQAATTNTENEKEALLQFRIKTLNGLGSIYYTIQNRQLAKYFFELAYKLDEDDPDICNQLAVVYTEERITEKALYYYEKGIKNYQRAHISNDKDLLIASMYMNMGLMFSYECDISKAIECYNKSLKYRPKLSLAYQNKLLDMNYISHNIDDDMYVSNAHKMINRVYDRVVTDYKVSNPGYKRKDADTDVINIGFVSGDFVCHPVNYFLTSVLDHIDYTKFRVFCYSSKVVRLEDRFPNCTWTCIRNMSAQAVCEQIQKHGIDMLFDLSGHTGDNRLDVFALKPSPIQINYIGYPNTTGLRSIDYRITDAFCDSPASEKYYSEKLLYMPNCFLSYTPSHINSANGKLPIGKQADLLPTLTQTPFSKNGYITFGSFNRFNKMNDRVVETWVRVLRNNPTARFVIKTKEFMSEKLKKKFVDKIPQDVLGRFEILGYSDTYSSHLVDYNKVDIALDTFPYSGTTTSCEALMMGVPILTIFDDERHYHSQNVTTSLLKNSGLDEYVCCSIEDYVAKATKLANKSSTAFKSLKETVRSKFLRGKVYNKKEFISSFQELLVNCYSQHFSK